MAYPNDYFNSESTKIWKNDPKFAYDYLRENFNEPIITIPNRQYLLTPASLTPLMPPNVPAAVVWNPFTLQFMLAINYGSGYGGWNFYNNWYPFYPYFRRYGIGPNPIGFRNYFGGVYRHNISKYNRVPPGFQDRFYKQHYPGGRPSSPVGRPNSPVGRPNSPVGRPNSPVGRPTSPVGRPTSPVGRPSSPSRGPSNRGVNPNRTISRDYSKNSGR
jgi:hypothetical protein